MGSTVSGGTKLHKYLEIPTEIGRQTKNDNGDHEIQIPQNIKTKKKFLVKINPYAGGTDRKVTPLNQFESNFLF